MPAETYLGFSLAQWLSFGFVSVFLNLSITYFTYARRNRKRALALLSAIEFECRFARQICNSYKRDSKDGTKAWAPAYRLSTDAMKDGVPWLRDHGFMLPAEVDEMMRLELRMHEVNRCLSLVEEGVKQKGGDEDAAHHFYSRQSVRCAGKCDHVLAPQPPDNEDGTVPGVLEVVEAACLRIRWG